MNPHIRTFLFVLALLPMLMHAQSTIELAAEDDWYPYTAEVGTVPKGFSV